MAASAGKLAEQDGYRAIVDALAAEPALQVGGLRGHDHEVDFEVVKRDSSGCVTGRLNVQLKCCTSPHRVTFRASKRFVEYEADILLLAALLPDGWHYWAFELSDQQALAELEKRGRSIQNKHDIFMSCYHEYYVPDIAQCLEALCLS